MILFFNMKITLENKWDPQFFLEVFWEWLMKRKTTFLVCEFQWNCLKGEKFIFVNRIFPQQLKTHALKICLCGMFLIFL